MLENIINADGIAFEVALEALGQGRQPFMQAITAERKKDKPSAVLIDYYEARIKALDNLQDSITPDDMDAVRRIFDKEAAFRIN